MKRYMVDADGWFTHAIDTELDIGIATEPPAQEDLGTFLRWQNDAWSWQPAPKYGFNCAGRIEVTSISGDEFRASDRDITVRINGTVVVDVKFLDKYDAPLALTSKFHMPLRSRDGRERLVLADVVDGLTSFMVKMPDSGVWSVTEGGISEDLPERFSFDGLTIRVVE